MTFQKKEKNWLRDGDKNLRITFCDNSFQKYNILVIKLSHYAGFRQEI